MSVKCIVVGLDGASWELLDKWIEKDLLNLKKFLSSGKRYKCKSCFPPSTVPNWKCYSTGKNPGKLGVFWFEKIDFENNKIYFPSSKDYNDSKEIWDYLNEKGLSSLVMNMPTTYPPKKINSIMISGGPDIKYDGTIPSYPQNILKELKERYGYLIHPKRLILSQKDKDEAKDIYSLIESRFKSFIYLLEKENPDFSHLTIFYINVLQHYFWDNEVTERAWIIIDEYIGKIRAKYDCDIILMSDHGSTPVEYVFNVNKWLEKEGYLKLKSSKSTLNKIGVNKDNLIKLSNKLRITNRIRRILPRFLYNLIPSGNENMGQSKEKRINWTKTKAIGYGQGIIGINTCLLEKEADSIQNEIITKIKNLKNRFNGKKIAKSVYKFKDIYKDKINSERGIVFEQNSIHTRGGVTLSNNIFEKEKKWSAENSMEGIFAINGPSVRMNNFKREKEILILDIAPTILYLMDCKIPKEMDGKVLKEIFQS